MPSVSNTTTISPSHMGEIYDQARANGSISEIELTTWEAIQDYCSGGETTKAMQEAYNAIKSLTDTNDNIALKIEKFKEFRNYAEPVNRQEFHIKITPSTKSTEDHRFCLLINKLIVFYGDIAPSDTDNFQIIKDCKNYLDADNHILGLQGNKLSAYGLLPPPGKAHISQGAVGDCAIVAIVAGIFSSAAIIPHIEKTLSLTENQELKIVFHTNINSNIAYNSPCSLDSVLGNPEFMRQMIQKGYQIEKSEHQTISIIFSNQRLQKIIDSTISAETNFLLCNIIEHLIGNFILAISPTIANPSPHSRRDAVDLTSDLPDGRNRSPSLDSYDSKLIKVFLPQELTSNLFGFYCHPMATNPKIQTITRAEINEMLFRYFRKERPDSSVNPFVTVGLSEPNTLYFIPSANHAYILHEIITEDAPNEQKTITEVVLINPHNTESRITMNFEDFYQRLLFTNYISPVEDLFHKHGVVAQTLPPALVVSTHE